MRWLALLPLLWFAGTVSAACNLGTGLLDPNDDITTQNTTGEFQQANASITFLNITCPGAPGDQCSCGYYLENDSSPWVLNSSGGDICIGGTLPALTTSPGRHGYVVDPDKPIVPFGDDRLYGTVGSMVEPGDCANLLNDPTCTHEWGTGADERNGDASKSWFMPTGIDEDGTGDPGWCITIPPGEKRTFAKWRSINPAGGCPTGADRPCFDYFSYLTLLGRAPPNSGDTTLRPPAVGGLGAMPAGVGPLETDVSDGKILWDLISQLSGAGTPWATFDGESQTEFLKEPLPYLTNEEEFRNRQADGNFAPPTYGRNVGYGWAEYLITAAHYPNSDSGKKKFIRYVLQAGQDIYYNMTNADTCWSSTGGHDWGPSLPVVAYGVWLGLPHVRTVTAASENCFKAKHAIYESSVHPGRILFGDPATEDKYWDQFEDQFSFTERDPYEHVDTLEKADGGYFGCCSPFREVAIAAYLNPAIRWAMEDNDRLVSFGVRTIDSGGFAAPDPCKRERPPGVGEDPLECVADVPNGPDRDEPSHGGPPGNQPAFSAFMQWCTTPYSPSNGFTWEGFCQAHGVYYDCAINRTCPGLGLDPNDVNPAPPVGQVVDDYAGGSPATITLTATCPDCSVQPTSVNFELDGTDSDCLFDDATDSTGPPFEATTGSLTTGTYYLGAQFVGGDIDTEEHCFQLIVDPTPRTIDTTILFGEGFQPFTIFDGDGFVQSLINPLLEKPNTQAINLANYPSDCLSLAFALAGQSAINGVHLNDADGFGPDQYIAPATQYIGCNPILSTTGSRDLIVSLCDSDGGTAAGGCTTAVDTATFNLAISDTSSCNDDGTVDDGEQCDDGAADNNDTSRCKADCTLNRCGDVKICADATGGFQCGDTQQTTVESCDDGNEDDVVCNALCSASACGNGTVEFDLGEECDNGPGASPGQTAATTTCFANCQLKLCGDGSRDPPEECDDRNDESGDGCSSNCNCECAIDPECLTCP